MLYPRRPRGFEGGQAVKKRGLLCVIIPGDYYFGDPRPPYEAGYSEFVEWQEAQLRQRKRKYSKAKETKG